MKKQIGLFTAILFAVSTLMMACKAEVHTHTFAEEWKTDENFHWKECECGEKKDFEEHTYDIRKVLQEPDCTQEGKKTIYCTVCEYEKEEKLKKASEHLLALAER